MANSASNQHLSVAEAIDDLRTLGISVDVTDQPIDFSTSKTRDDGRVTATVGAVTITLTGRAFVELYDSTENVQLTVLDEIEEAVEIARSRRGKVAYLSCTLRPETVLELRQWAELRDELLVGA
jgi:hypothetical protein